MILALVDYAIVRREDPASSNIAPRAGLLVGRIREPSCVASIKEIRPLLDAVPLSVIPHRSTETISAILTLPQLDRDEAANVWIVPACGIAPENPVMLGECFQSATTISFPVISPTAPTSPPLDTPL